MMKRRLVPYTVLPVLICLFLLFFDQTIPAVFAAEASPESLLEELSLSDANREFRSHSAIHDVSFKELVLRMVRGELSLSLSSVKSTCKEIFFTQLQVQKQLAIRVLLLALISAVFFHFIRIFENSQIAEIGFYVVYLAASSILIQSFWEMNTLTKDSLSELGTFMQVLLPPYLFTLVLSSGSLSAIGFSEVSLLLIQLLHTFLIHMVLPLIRFYFILLILNELAGEDLLSKTAALLKAAVEWTTRTLFGAVIGLQTVQVLITPAIDLLKNSAAHRLIRALPGIGNAFGSVADTVAGASIILKNAVGTAGMLAILLICMTPFFKLAADLFLFRLLAAVLQPFGEKRLVSCVDSLANCALLLLRTLLSGMAMFLISLAMMTAAVRGG